VFGAKEGSAAVGSPTKSLISAKAKKNSAGNGRVFLLRESRHRQATVL
jgi:hypothetical protein